MAALGPGLDRPQLALVEISCSLIANTTNQRNAGFSFGFVIPFAGSIDHSFALATPRIRVQLTWPGLRRPKATRIAVLQRLNDVLANVGGSLFAMGAAPYVMLIAHAAFHIVNYA
jgi:hypothetical protein